MGRCAAAFLAECPRFLMGGCDGSLDDNSSNLKCSFQSAVWYWQNPFSLSTVTIAWKILTF